jgi:putative tryptophan/tyrosine transport system substrate-binding protein
VPNAMFTNQRETIIGQALVAGLPAFIERRQDVEVGGFMSYGVNQTEGSHRAAVFVDKILKGAKPGDLPIEFATNIELVINLKTAKVLGLEIPPSLLARADEVIE